MIVPMKKVSIIVQSKDATSAVENLRSLGVLHVEYQNVPKGKDVIAIREDIDLVERVINILSGEEFSKGRAEKTGDMEDWRLAARHIIDSWKRLDQIKEYTGELKGKIAKWESWGEFDPEMIRALAERDVYVKLYDIPERDIKRLPKGVILRKFFVTKGVAHCAVISDRDVDIPFKELTPPQAGLKEMRERISEGSRVIKSVKDEIRSYAQHREGFMKVKESLEKEAQFQEAINGMGESGSLRYLRGYVPHDTVDTVLKTSKRERWGIMISEPSDEDRIPTLIRNPRWVSLIEPVFKVLGILPGYKELDISLWFLIFFSKRQCRRINSRVSGLLRLPVGGHEFVP